MAQTNDTITHESTPLLGDDLKPGIPVSTVRELGSLTRRDRLKRAFRAWEAVIICGLTIFLVDLGLYIFNPAYLRATELMICREHYARSDPSVIDGRGNIPEHLCKTDSISEELAILRGWLITLDNISGVVVAVPFGLLADRYGRRLITIVAMIGEMLAIAWQLIIFQFYNTFHSKDLMTASAFRLIGGGAAIIGALVMALIADSVSDERRATAFFYAMATVTVAELAGSPIASLLMSNASNWTALLVGYVIMCVSTPVIWFAPERKRLSEDDLSVPGVHQFNSPNDNGYDGTMPNHALVQANEATFSTRYREKLISAAIELRSLGHLLFQNKNVLYGLLAFLTSRITPQLVYIMPQYVSKRYGWSIAEANLLNPFRDLVDLVVLCLVLPLLTAFLLRSPRSFSPPRTDALITRTSVVFLALGCLIFGLAATPPPMLLGLLIYTLGFGYRAALQSFMTASVPRGSVATLYVAVSVVDTVGSLVAAPLMAVTLARGIRRGSGGGATPGGKIPVGGNPSPPPGGGGAGVGGGKGPTSRWIGLPYLVAAVVYVLMGLSTMGMNVRDAEACAERNRGDVGGAEGEVDDSDTSTDED